MADLKKVLKRLEKAGYKVNDEKEISSDVKFLGSVDVLSDNRSSFIIRYFKDEHFTLETSWSNQIITENWMTKLKKLRLILK